MIGLAKNASGGVNGPQNRWSCHCNCHYRKKMACNICGCAKTLDSTSSRGWQ